MIKRSSFVMIAAAAVFAAGCTDTSNIPPPQPPADDSTPPPDPTFAVQVIHASGDAPTVNVSVGSNTGGLSGIDYKESRTARSYPLGDYTITVDAVLPDDGDDTTDDVIAGVLTEDITGAEGDFVAYFAFGNVAGDAATDLRDIQFTRSGSVPAGEVQATILHAAAGAPGVDVYITEDGDDRGMPVNTAPVTFGQSLELPPIPEGDYVIEVTAAGDATAVFDSGVVSLTGGTDPIVAAVDNTNAGSDSIISALVVGRLDFIEVQDTNSQAEVRVIHTISDLSANVDVQIDGAVAFGDVAFGDVAPDQVAGGNGARLDADDYTIQVFSTGTTTCLINCGDDTTDPATDPDETTLAAGVFYDAIAQGLSVPAEGATEPDPAPALAYEADDRRAHATSARVRLIHSAGSVADVDVYLSPEGATAPAADDLAAEDVEFGDNTGFVAVAAGSYVVFVTAADSTDPVRTVPITVADGGVYTAIVIDGAAQTDVIALDDFTTGGT